MPVSPSCGWCFTETIAENNQIILIMKKQYLFTTLLFGLLGVIVCAQDIRGSKTGYTPTNQAFVYQNAKPHKAAPNGSGDYYAPADGKSGQALKTAMYQIIKLSSPAPIGYDGLYEAYKKTDTRADGYVRDWYSNTTKYKHVTDKAGSYNKEGDCYNREHLVPQSWFGSGVPKSDIMHVVPTDGYVNNKRGNIPLAEVAKADYVSNGGYCKRGTCKTPGYTGDVFEPNDEIKGDIARIYFYMVTAYQDLATKWGNVFDGKTYPGFDSWYLTMLMRWSKQDPVDEVEIARNNAVYSETKQKNRNPFVDYPGLEDYIWGDKTDVPFSYDNYDSGIAYVARPTFESQTNEDGSVTVSINTDDDATIYYTTDGSDPTTDSELYSGPFTLTETTTVKAIAVTSEGQSGVAQQRFTVSQGGTDTPPAGDGSYVRVNSTDELVSGATYLLVYEEESNKGYAMSIADDQANNGERVDIIDDTIENGTLPLVLTQLSNGNWTICAGSNTYLSHDSAKNSIGTASSGSDNSAQWTITISGGDADIINKNTSYAIRFNKADNQMRFRCYKQGNQEPVALYIQTGQATQDGIKEMRRNTDEMRKNAPIFTIDGRMVTTTATLPRGVYIIGGKKMVVK